MQNGAVIALDVTCHTLDTGENVYLIQPDSVEAVHRDFKP